MWILAIIFTSILFLLKVLGLITISWWMVFSPIGIYIALWLLIVLVGFLLTLLFDR